MKTEVRTITPGIAKEMLKNNPNNRKLSDIHLSFLAQEMFNGNWLFDGSPIRLDGYGRLLDGQHRLNAVVKSDTAQEFLIVSGIDSNAFKVMDTGRNRSSSDVLKVEGFEYFTLLSTAIKLIISLEENKKEGRQRVSNTVVLEYAKNHRELKEICRKSDTHYVNFGKILSRKLIVSFLAIFSRINVIDAELFMGQVCNGLGLSAGDPSKALRDKLISDKVSDSKLPESIKIALCYKAWNLYRKNKKVSHLKMPSDDSLPKLV